MFFAQSTFLPNFRSNKKPCIQAPLLGPLGGFGAGGLLAGLAGYKTKDSILNTINTIANVADAKIGLLNLGANLVGTGLDAVKAGGIFSPEIVTK